MDTTPKTLQDSLLRLRTHPLHRVQNRERQDSIQSVAGQTRDLSKTAKDETSAIGQEADLPSRMACVEAGNAKEKERMTYTRIFNTIFQSSLWTV